MSVQMQLEDFFITRLHIDWRPPTKKTVDVNHVASDFDYDVAVHAHDSKRYKLDLQLRLKEVGKQQPDVGYVIEVGVVGLFSFPADADEKTRQTLVRVNGVSMLYSTMRGALAGITGMFPGGKIALPSIMPQAIVQQVEGRKRAQMAPKLEAAARK